MKFVKNLEINSEGLMLKSKNSIYHAGRKKRRLVEMESCSLTIDAVLIYAQKRLWKKERLLYRLYFCDKRRRKLVTIAKAYSGLTDKEIMEINKFIQ